LFGYSFGYSFQILQMNGILYTYFVDTKLYFFAIDNIFKMVFSKINILWMDTSIADRRSATEKYYINNKL
jgi:hypothetical protein